MAPRHSQDTLDGATVKHYTSLRKLFKNVCKTLVNSIEFGSVADGAGHIIRCTFWLIISVGTQYGGVNALAGGLRWLSDTEFGSF